MIRRRQTKIVATLGPSSSTPEMIRALFEAGVDVFRLNFSHGTHDDHRMRLLAIRAIEKEFGYPVGVIADLQGPKLRIGRFAGGEVRVCEGHKIRLDLDPVEGDASRVNLPHPEIVAAMNPGDDILLDDGKVRMTVCEKGAGFLVAQVRAGSVLKDKKGFNIPGVVLPIDPLPAKDRADLAAALEMGVDWIAQSFVQSADDVRQARTLIDGRAGLIAKIEKPSALESIQEIIELADGIMLARGDLGVEIPPEDVPAAQKRVVRQVRFMSKPIIVATQMLESMTDNARPTRAEASDVATAVYDGTDAVMLSAETASGHYPLEAVEIMDKIARRTESDATYRRIIESDPPTGKHSVAYAITRAACETAMSIGAACITNYTSTGSTTLRTARERPGMPILCLTENLSVARRLCLSYGVRPVHVAGATNFAEAVQKAIAEAQACGVAVKGEEIVLTAGVPFGTPGSTNILRVAKID